MNPNLLTKMPMFNPGLFQPLVFSLNRIEQTYYTGLHLVRDPGVPLVALGGLLMVAGLIVVFFIQYQRLWVFGWNKKTQKSASALPAEATGITSNCKRK
jgi:cytochrome c biogenesis protein